jgi:hypothetical protein
VKGCSGKKSMLSAMLYPALVISSTMFFPSDAVLKNPVKTETPTAIMFNYRYSPVRF